MAKVKGYQVTVSGVSAGTEQSCSLSIQNNLQEEEEVSSGEAEIVESDNDNGENETGGAV